MAFTISTHPITPSTGSTATGTITVSVTPATFRLTATAPQSPNTASGAIDIVGVGYYSTGIAQGGTANVSRSVDIVINTIGTFNFTITASFGGSSGNEVRFAEIGAPPPTTYTATQTATISRSFTKNDCLSNQTGSSETISRTETATATSQLSQADADQQALALATANANTWLDNNGQAVANTQGTCSNPNSWTSTANAEASGNFAKNNCGSNQIGSVITYKATATATATSTISQADADQQALLQAQAQAQALVDANGQDYANANGVCKTPYFYISKANSLRFARKRIDEPNGNYKTDERLFSCEAEVQKAYKEVQEYVDGDQITTQFKSNYEAHSVFTTNDNGLNKTFATTKITNNLGLKDSRTSNLISKNGKAALYFTAGDLLDYDSGSFVSTYTLDGFLPEYAKIGATITILNTVYNIVDIVFDEQKNADMILTDVAYTGPGTVVVAKCLYDRFDYDVYEFTVTMIANQRFKVQIRPDFTSTYITPCDHISEEIFVHDTTVQNSLEIRYYNNTNTDVMYSTGIEFMLRLPYIKISGKVDENTDTHKTDANVLLLHADLYEADEFLFEPVTKEIWRKLTIALSHENVFINSVGYVKNGTFSTDGPLDRSNLYVLTANMIKTGFVYNSQTTGMVDDGAPIQMPNLVNTNIGYVQL